MIRKLLSAVLFVFHQVHLHFWVASAFARNIYAFCFGLGVFLLCQLFLNRSQANAIIRACNLYDGVFKLVSGLLFLATWISVAVLLIWGSLNHDKETILLAYQLAIVGCYIAFYMLLPCCLADYIRDLFTPRTPLRVPTREPKVIPTRPTFNAQAIAELQEKLKGKS